MLTALDEQQQSLSLRVVRDMGNTVEDSVISKQPDLLSAIKLCISSSGLNDNQVAMELEIQEAQFSRILKGQAHFPPNKLEALMDFCGNEIPLRWLAMHRGYGLVKLKSRLEGELEDEKQKNAELEMKLQHFEEFQKIVK